MCNNIKMKLYIWCFWHVFQLLWLTVSKLNFIWNFSIFFTYSSPFLSDYCYFVDMHRFFCALLLVDVFTLVYVSFLWLVLYHQCSSISWSIFNVNISRYSPFSSLFPFLWNNNGKMILIINRPTTETTLYRK